MRETSTDDPLQIARHDLLPLHAIEQHDISWVLEKRSGNKRQAAEILEIDPSTLYRREEQGKA